MLSVALTSQTFAQYAKGDNLLNVGIGVGAYGLSGSGIPIVASFEHGFTDKISAGIVGGIASTNYSSYYKYSYYYFGARGSYHLNEVLNVSNDKLDVYAGASLYYRGYSFKYDGPFATVLDKNSGGTVGIGIHGGARYYFSNNIGAYAEVGYGIAALQLGLTLKF